MRSARSGAMNQFLDGLSQGDPVAIGLAAFVGLLVVAGITIWVVDRRARQKEAARKSSRTRR